MADTYLDLPLTLTGTPSGAAGGGLSGTYPNPDVASVGGSSAANIHTSQLLTAASTDAATASTLVKRDANGNTQLAALTMVHVSAGVDNVGMGGPASASANYPLLIQRSLSTPIVTQTSNPSTGAGSGAKDQIVADNGNNFFEMGQFASATVAPDAYAGGAATLRSSGGTPGISVIADDSATFIKHFVGGNSNAALALKIDNALIATSYGGVILATAGSRPAAGVSYRGMMFVTQGGGGTADKISVCLKAAGGTYSWVDIVSG